MKNFAEHMMRHEHYTNVATKILTICANERVKDNFDQYYGIYNRVPAVYFEEFDVDSTDHSLVNIKGSYYLGDNNETYAIKVQATWLDEFDEAIVVEGAKTAFNIRMAANAEQKALDDAATRDGEIAKLKELRERHPDVVL